MEDCRVSVETHQVEIVLVNGTRILGEMFLQTHGMSLVGPQRVGEALNDDDCFLPIRTEGEVKLINLDQVVAVYASAESEFDPLLALGEEYQVRVTPSVGEPLEARIFVNLPSGSIRVKDFLNQAQRFLLFLLGDQVVYLAQKRILLVED